MTGRSPKYAFSTLRPREKLGPKAFVFGTDNGEFLASFKTAWESLLLMANGHETERAKAVLVSIE